MVRRQRRQESCIGARRETKMSAGVRGVLIGIALAPLALGAPRSGGRPAASEPVSVALPATTGSRGQAVGAPTPGLDSLLRTIEARAPFRADRRPASAKFGSDPTAAPPPPPVPKPQLVLHGIVWGAEPAIVLDRSEEPTSEL